MQPALITAFAPDPVQVALIVLIIAGIWAIVELALTLKGVRKDVHEVSGEAKETLERISPLAEDVLTKVDGILDEAQPSVESLDPMILKLNENLDEMHSSLKSVNVILGDVEQISGTAKGVTGAVNSVAANAADGVNKLVDKLTGKKSRRK